MTDVRLIHAPDGGEIQFTAGLVLDEGLESAAYLSLFGGNREDNGTTATEPLQWWANRNETNPSRAYRSATQAALIGLPLTTGNLQIVKQAAERDLAWLVSEGVASSVSVSVSILARNTIRIQITAVVEQDEIIFAIQQRWPIQ